MQEDLVRQRIKYLVEHGGLYPERSQIDIVICLLSIITLLSVVELVIAIAR